MDDFWTFNRQLAQRLLYWSGFSVAAGLAMGLGGRFWQGVGSQFIGWGVVDAAIALFGGWSARRKAELPDAHTAARQAGEAANLERLLWINAGLDILYMLGGRWLVRQRGETDARWQGMGWGIIVQGAFLFWFDLVHALLLRRWRHG
jgi:hypothetical protein